MKEKLDKVLDVTKLRHTLALEQRRLLEQYKINSAISVNGGTFTITRELLTFVDAAIEYYSTSCVILDDSQRPILIANLQKFKNDLWAKYHSATTTFYDETETLRKKRTVKAIVKL
jgi:hypothetical protein